MAKKRRKTKALFHGYLILVSAIVMLNFIGISYAYWNEGIEVSTSVITGTMMPQFSGEYSIDDIEGKGNISVSFDADNTTMYIWGEVESGYKAILNYSLCNRGTIPIKFYGQNSSQNDGYNLMSNQQMSVIYPGEALYGRGMGSELDIQVGENINDEENSKSSESMADVKDDLLSDKNANEIQQNSKTEGIKSWNYDFQFDLSFEQFNN